MKKPALTVDALVVETFVPAGAEDRRSRGLPATRPQVCDPFTLPPRCA